ncbi:MAG: ABC transporter permease subunit, partial [bacterium]
VIVPAIGRLALCFGIYSSGYCLLSGSIVLAIMACPFIINVSHEVLAGVPDGVREASLALGATRWQTVKYVVLRKARPGVLAAIMLGFARAIGETIAVLMVVGNIATIPRSLFDPAYPLPALLANNYGEMMSIPHYDAALMLSALVLLVIVLCFNLLAKATLIMIRSDAA